MGRQAREFYEASLAALASNDTTSDGGSRGHVSVVVGTGDAVLTSMFLIATAVVPTIYNSNDHIHQASGVDVTLNSKPKARLPELNDHIDQASDADVTLNLSTKTGLPESWRTETTMSESAPDAKKLLVSHEKAVRFWVLFLLAKKPNGLARTWQFIADVTFAS